MQSATSFEHSGLVRTVVLYGGHEDVSLLSRTGGTSASHQVRGRLSRPPSLERNERRDQLFFDIPVSIVW